MIYGGLIGFNDSVLERNLEILRLAKNLRKVLHGNYITGVIFVKFRSSGGKGGIRTHDRVAPIHAFQGCSLCHSDTFPTINVNGGGERS